MYDSSINDTGGYVQMKKLLIVVIGALMLAGCGSDDSEKEISKAEEMPKQDEVNEDVLAEEEEEESVEEIEELSPKDEMILKVIDLIDEGLAFDSGSYIKGDIPKGEYAFVPFEGSGEYYSEEDSGGNIVDNENFSSFGYVQVHEAGNLETRGALVSGEGLEKLEVSGAKELYEIVNDKENYLDAGWYKVGKDIEPGEYVIESYGSGYVAVMTGPVGNSDIVDNENFNGKYTVNLQEGQYLKVSNATITE